MEAAQTNTGGEATSNDRSPPKKTRERKQYPQPDHAVRFRIYPTDDQIGALRAKTRARGTVRNWIVDIFERSYARHIGDEKARKGLTLECTREALFDEIVRLRTDPNYTWLRCLSVWSCTLIGDQALERIAVEYERGADVTVGSMLRTDKETEYPVCFDRPRERRGGNVWQHLRSFRKRLFDAIPDAALRLDGEYIDLANDWAFMIPIVEMAARPVHIAQPVYLYEPSGKSKDGERERREATIKRIMRKAPAQPRHAIRQPPRGRSASAIGVRSADGIQHRAH